MPSSSLSLKVLLAFVAGTLLSIALLVAAAMVALQTQWLARMDLADLAQDVAGKIRFDAAGQPLGLAADLDDLAWVYDSLGRETAYRLLDGAGQVRLLSPAGAAFWPAQMPVPPLARGHLVFERDGLVLHAATHALEREGQTWYFQVAVSTRLMTLLHRVALPLVGAGIVVFSLVLLLVFGGCAYFTLRCTLKPLRAVSESAAAIAPRSIHARLQMQAVPAEIAPLVDSFNRVLERLEQGYRVQQEFLAQAAHELKTPLALIRAQIELGHADAPERQMLLSDVQYMSRQVAQLLLLAEASEVQNYHCTAVSVQAVVEEVVGYLQRMAEAADVHLLMSAAAGDVVWHADRGALFTLLKNLLENAIQHAPAGTTVQVDIQPSALNVRDFGLGVAAAQLPRLFERFWRGPHRRDLGAGLGLAICQEIAQAHGWQLSAERAEPGLCLSVRLAPQV